ncbi:MAG: FliM/FliN family flagellar motor switch protein [Caulobacterales bacterium]
MTFKPNQNQFDAFGFRGQDTDRPTGDTRAHGTVPQSTLGALIDNVDVTVETYIGETPLSIADLNALRPGSVVPLEASLSDLVELRVNGVTIAHGELVAVGDKFGVRITAIAP